MSTNTITYKSETPPSLKTHGGSLGAQTLDLADGNAAPTAVDDIFAASEDVTISDNVFEANPARNVSMDSDPDGDLLTVIAINGDENLVGIPIVLPSGASLTLNSDGSLFYDPRVGFNDMSSGERTTDSFTYTISDGNGGYSTATVSVAISGRHDAFWGTPLDDILQGTDGSDSFQAGAGNDVIMTGRGSDWADGGGGRIRHCRL